MIKKIFVASQILVAALAFSTEARAGQLIETLVPIDHVFAPRGFDANDDTQVIIAGFLPDLCYKAPQSKYVQQGDSIRITVTARKESDPNVACPRAIVPFLEVVSVGVLDKGNYSISVNKESMYQQDSSIYVSDSTSSAVDEHIYAYVDSVTRKTVGSRTVVLRGYNPSDCFDLDRVEFVSNEKDTYSVLPILKQRWEICPLKLVPFEYEVEVPNTIAREEVLLHVRVMNGKSVNTLFRERE